MASGLVTRLTKLTESNHLKKRDLVRIQTALDAKDTLDAVKIEVLYQMHLNSKNDPVYATAMKHVADYIKKLERE